MIKEIETHTRSNRCCCHESLMAQNIHPMLTQCWSTVRDAMLAYRLLNQNKVNSCLHIWCCLLVQFRSRWLKFKKKTFCQNKNGTNRKVCFENDGWEHPSFPSKIDIVFKQRESFVIGLLPPCHKWYNDPPPPFAGPDSNLTRLFYASESVCAPACASASSTQSKMFKPRLIGF